MYVQCFFVLFPTVQKSHSAVEPSSSTVSDPPTGDSATPLEGVSPSPSRERTAHQQNAVQTSNEESSTSESLSHRDRRDVRNDRWLITNNRQPDHSIPTCTVYTVFYACICTCMLGSMKFPHSYMFLTTRLQINVDDNCNFVIVKHKHTCS